MTDFQLLSTLLIFSWFFWILVIFYFNKRIGSIEVTAEVDRHVLTKRILTLEEIFIKQERQKAGPSGPYMC